LKFEKQEHWEKCVKEYTNRGDVNKIYKKLNTEIIHLSNVMSIYPSFRG